jgi:N-acetylglucosamine-6-phosphate deacetylase
VVIEGDTIVAVLPEWEVPPADRQPVEGLLAPGFIDLQVNGGGGVLFNDAPTVDGIAAIGAAHRRYGTTGFLPTLISDTREQMAAAMEAATEALRAGTPGVLGVHIEGPFFNPARRGAHAAGMIRTIEDSDLATLATPTGGRTLVTLAPEMVDPAQIRQLAHAGIVVAAGHTEADVATIATARRAGLSGFTHLFNAMPPFAGRAPGPVGAALADADAWASLIVDLHHVSATSLCVALAAKGWRRCVLITDAMATPDAVGDGFVLTGQAVSLKDGCLVTAEGKLAGSLLDMATAVRNTVNVLGLPLEAALQMASRIPAEVIGLGDRLGRIAPGHRADLVLLDDAIHATRTWIGGVESD